MQVAFLTSFAAFPWVVKPLYGFLSDTVPIFGYRRRSYLIICGLLGTELTFRVFACKIGINAIQNWHQGNARLASRQSNALAVPWSRPI